MKYEVYLPLCGCSCDSDWDFLGIIYAKSLEEAQAKASAHFACSPESLYVVTCHHTIKTEEPVDTRSPHLTK